MVTLKDAVAETRAHFDLQTCPARAPRHEDSLRPGRITTAMTRSETKAATWKYTSGSFRISEFTVRRRFRQEFLNSVIVFASCICRSPRLFLQGRCDIPRPTIHQPFTNHAPTIHQPFTNHSPTIHQPFTNHSPTIHLCHILPQGVPDAVAETAEPLDLTGPTGSKILLRWECQPPRSVYPLVI